MADFSSVNCFGRGNLNDHPIPVLLLDEADVFLEERSLADLERNSLVSGMVTLSPSLTEVHTRPWSHHLPSLPLDVSLPPNPRIL